MVKQEAQRLETERRERGREVWLANMKGEIADFSAEEGLSPEQTTELQDMTEDFFLAMTDMRHAIYDGSLDATQAREDMKVFREEHQARLIDMLGEDGAQRLQRRRSHTPCRGTDSWGVEVRVMNGVRQRREHRRPSTCRGRSRPLSARTEARRDRP